METVALTFAENMGNCIDTILGVVNDVITTVTTNEYLGIFAFAGILGLGIGFLRSLK